MSVCGTTHALQRQIFINNKNETDYGKYFLKDCCR